MSGVPINCQNLKTARLNAGYSTIEAIGVIFGKRSKSNRISEWENGESTPTWKQLQKIALAYHVNPFVLTTNEQIKKNRNINDFRQTESDKALSLNTKKYLNFLLQRQNYLSDCLKKENAPKNTLVTYKNDAISAEALANTIKKKLNYQYTADIANHLKYLISLLEEYGVFVMKTLSYWPIEVEDMRGVYLKDNYAPIIALNRKDTKTAQLFTLAHEIAHLFTNSEAISNVDFRNDISNREEIFCNKVAANLLLPAVNFKQEYYSLDDIKQIANDYQVSQLVVFYRLKTLNKITSDNLEQFKTTLLENMQQNIITHNKGKTGGNSHNNMKDSNGSFFNKFISSLYFENKINAFEASKILKFSIEQI